MPSVVATEVGGRFLNKDGLLAGKSGDPQCGPLLE